MIADRTKSLKEMMIFGGLWLDFSGHRFGSFLFLFQIFRLCYLAVGWFLIMNVMLIQGPKFLLTPTAVFIPLGACVITTSIIVLWNMKKIEKLIEISDADLNSYKEKWEIQMIESDNRDVIYLANLFKYGISLFTVIYMVLPIAIDTGKVIFGYPEPYVAPLPFDGYFDGNKSRDFKFYLIIFASDLWFMFGIPNTIAFQTHLFFVVSYTTTQIKIMQEHVKRLFDEKDNGTLLLPPWDFTVIVKRHQQIIRLNSLQRNCVPLPYLMQGLISTLSLTFIMYLISQLFGNDNLVVCLAVAFIIILSGIMYIICYAGNFLEEKSDELFRSLCNLPWYRQPPSTRKNFLMIVAEASRPLVLDYNRSSSLNLQTFKLMINNAFSYFMLMNSLEN